MVKQEPRLLRSSPRLIALDWSRTSRRAFLMDDAVDTRGERITADGIAPLTGGLAAFMPALRQLASR